MKSRDIWQLFGQVGGSDAEIVGVCESSDPRPHHLAFIRRYSDAALDLTREHAETLFLVELRDDVDWPASCLPVANPRLAFAVASQELVGHRPDPGVAHTAIIHPDATIDPSASIGHFTLVDEGVTVGPGTVIGSHVRLRSGVRIGSDCVVANHTSIGSSGFGFEVAEDGRPIRIAHVGGVTIGDRVEIGTNVSIAQGTVRPTVIGDDVKIDDAVFIAHNVRIGDATYVIAGSSVCGSVDVGSGVWISPEATIIQKVSIGDGALVGLGAVVVRDVEANSVVAGVPAKHRGDRT